MADAPKKVTLRNISSGIRGVNTVNGYRDLERNEVATVEMLPAEVKSAQNTGYFTFGKEAGDEPEAPEPVPSAPNPTEAVAPGTSSGPTPGATGGGSSDELDAMDDDTLRTTAAALSGKSEAELADTDREGLLKLARGE